MFLPKKLNPTVVTLISKMVHKPTISNFRLISCTNVLYKIITKILLNKLASFVPSLINPAQTTLLKCKNITDNCLLAHEVLRGFERTCWKGSMRCLVKIDIEKAYNSIS